MEVGGYLILGPFSRDYGSCACVICDLSPSLTYNQLFHISCVVACYYKCSFAVRRKSDSCPKLLLIKHWSLL